LQLLPLAFLGRAPCHSTTHGRWRGRSSPNTAVCFQDFAPFGCAFYTLPHAYHAHHHAQHRLRAGATAAAAYLHYDTPRMPAAPPPRLPTFTCLRHARRQRGFPLSGSVLMTGPMDNVRDGRTGSFKRGRDMATRTCAPATAMCRSGAADAQLPPIPTLPYYLLSSLLFLSACALLQTAAGVPVSAFTFCSTWLYIARRGRVLSVARLQTLQAANTGSAERSTLDTSCLPPAAVTT